MPTLISNQKCAMSRSGGICLSVDFSRIVCRWVRIMWKKTCFLVRGGAYAFEKRAKLHCVPRLTHSTSKLTTQSTYERLPVPSHPGAHRQYLIWGPCLLSATKLPQWQSLSPRVLTVPAQCQARHGECPNNVYDPKEIIPPEDCLFLDAISALPRLTSPESNARIKVRLGFLM